MVSVADIVIIFNRVFFGACGLKKWFVGQGCLVLRLVGNNEILWIDRGF